MDYYYEQLDGAEKTVYTQCLKALRKMEKTVVVHYQMNSESVGRVRDALHYDHTGLFFVDFGRIYFRQEFLKTTLYFPFTEDDETVKKQRRWLRALLKKLEEEKNKDTSVIDDRTLLRWIHHRLVRNVTYDHDALKSPEDHPRAFNILGVLADGKAVCAGIAYTFKLLCDYFGIPCLVAIGKASLRNIGSDLGHAWNIVCLNGKYTHVDITWDVGVSEMSSFYRYDYFCIPDAWIRQDHEFSGYPACTDESLNYFETKKRVFKDYRSLKVFLRNELKKNPDYVYFKMSVRDTPENIVQKTDTLVLEAIGKYAGGKNSMQRLPGGIQFCLFYRIMSR